MTPWQHLHYRRTYERRTFCTGDGVRREELIFMSQLRVQHLDMCWCIANFLRPFLLLWGLGTPLPATRSGTSQELMCLVLANTYSSKLIRLTHLIDKETRIH